MKGDNTIEVNEATMIEALQEYFDKRHVAPLFKVIGVSVASGKYDPDSWRVAVSEIPASTGEPR